MYLFSSWDSLSVKDLISTRPLLELVLNQFSEQMLRKFYDYAGIAIKSSIRIVPGPRSLNNPDGLLGIFYYYYTT